MFDAENVGFAALDWDDLMERRLGFDDNYYLSEDMAIPFDPDHQWQEGDAIPWRALRLGEGSRADIPVLGEARWQDGFWDVALVRRMSLPAALILARAPVPAGAGGAGGR